MKKFILFAAIFGVIYSVSQKPTTKTGTSAPGPNLNPNTGSQIDPVLTTDSTED